MVSWGNLRGLLIVSCLSATLWLSGASQGLGQSPGEAGATPAAAAAKFDAADNAWVLTSAALVLFMTAPALALFYSGLVRKKNVLSVMMQCVFLMCLMTVLWALYGYSLVFGGTEAWIGDGRYLFMRGVNAVWTSHGPEVPLFPGLSIPAMTHMLFQGMFFIITPALICGAFAERMKFSAMCLFLTLWAIVVYSPMAHMVWGKGGFLNASLGGKIPCLDFAGGTVVHVTSGVSALVCALYLGKRVGYPKEPSPPHSVVLSFIGACLLWVGWFGFNAGSAVNASGLATSAFVNTHFATAAAAIGWAVAEWIRNGKPSALGAISGAVAGLVAITPASGFVQPMSALAIGLIAGVICSFMVFEVKSRLGYDDSLDAFGVHGAGGTVGALLTGIFAASVINPVFKDAAGNPLPSGAIDGHWGQMLNQLAGVGIAWSISIVGTLVLLFVVDKVMGLRVSAEDEAAGLDLSQHGEEGYDFNT